MPKTPPDGCQRVIPYIGYADAPAAMEFLSKAFGFEDRFHIEMPDGRIGHAEMAFGDNVLMLASAFEEMGLTSPKNLSAVHGVIMCYVDDVDAHFVRAKAAGATITAEPTDQPYGDRSYRAIDPEGHHWIFATVVKEVSLEEVQAHYGKS